MNLTGHGSRDAGAVVVTRGMSGTGLALSPTLGCLPTPSVRFTCKSCGATFLPGPDHCPLCGAKA